MSKDSQYRARLSQQVPVDKKRSRELDWEDTRRPAWVAWLAGLCLLVLFIGILGLSASDRVSAPQNINGDQLGPFDTASNQEYFQQAEQSLRDMQGEQARWALVTPKDEANPVELTEPLRDPELRVSTLLVGPVQWVLPEPAKGLQRKDVLQQATRSMAAGAGLRESDIKAEGVLVYGTPEQLRKIAEQPKIAAVEPAAADAVYGRMGVRPVSADSPGMNAQGQKPQGQNSQGQKPQGGAQ